MGDPEDTTSLWAVTPRPTLQARIPALLGIGGGVPRLVTLLERETVFGRGAEVDVPLTVRGVSRAHAKIVVAAAASITLVDLESRNGTFVNGDPVDLVTLSEGDEIHLGPIASFQYVRRIADELDAAERRVGTGRLGELTPREQQVAREVAKGRSNPEVATALGIKPRTVAAHLEHIFAKLDIKSRGQLTRMVAEAEVTASGSGT